MAYDPEDVEPERLAYEGKSADVLLGHRELSASVSTTTPVNLPPELVGFATQYRVQGMDKMTIEEYRRAMDSKISTTTKLWRQSRRVVGSATVDEYMRSLQGPPRDWQS